MAEPTPEELAAKAEEQKLARAETDRLEQEKQAAEEASKRMECPLDGKGQRGKHGWLWLWTTLPDGRKVWTDKLQCQHCLAIRQSSRAEGDVILETQNREAIDNEPIVGARSE